MKRALALVLALSVLGCASGRDKNPTSADLASRAYGQVEAWLARKFPGTGELQYALAMRDLNGDGKDEAIAYVSGPGQCGSGGCTAIVLAPDGSSWRQVMNAPLTRLPITLLDSSTNGWRDLSVAVGASSAPAGAVRLRFDGAAYPANPTALPAEPGLAPGELLIPSDPFYNRLLGRD